MIKQKENKILKPGDFLIAFVLLCISLAFMLIPKEKGSTLYIKVNEKLAAVYSLNQAKEKHVTVKGAVGEMHICIADGKAWVTDSACKNKLCVRMGKISRNGEVIVCLPNRVVISVKSIKDREIDAVTM
ncbi:NusG domain II-containing protein [bacterium]|nr:NusG domain II-containing protein [bacterium]